MPPYKTNSTSSMINELKKIIGHLNKTYPVDQIIIIGDFNMNSIEWTTLQNENSASYFSPVNRQYNNNGNNFIRTLNSNGLYRMSSICNSRGVQLDLILSNRTNNLTVCKVEDSRLLTYRHICVFDSHIDNQKMENSIIKRRNSARYFYQNILLVASEEDIKEALFDKCDNLLNKMEIVTKQFKFIQDKHSISRAFEKNSSSSTKPWTKTEKFTKLSRARKNIQYSLPHSKTQYRNKS